LRIGDERDDLFFMRYLVVNEWAESESGFAKLLRVQGRVGYEMRDSKKSVERDPVCSKVRDEG